MKNINQMLSTNKYLIIFALLFSLSISGMETKKRKRLSAAPNFRALKQQKLNKQPTDYENFFKDKSLKVLKYIYFQESFILESENIFVAIKKLKSLNSIFFTCKNLYNFRSSARELHKQILEMYRITLRNHFLEKQTDQMGLYPKNGDWDAREFNARIAQFIENPNSDDPILADLIAYNPKIESLTELTELLLFYNANPNTRTDNAMTPLMHAALRADVQLVALLLAHSCEIDAKNYWGNTALMFAIDDQKDSKEIVEMLLIKGANPDICGFNGSAIHKAERFGYTEILKLLKKHQKIISCILC